MYNNNRHADDQRARTQVVVDTKAPNSGAGASSADLQRGLEIPQSGFLANGLGKGGLPGGPEEALPDRLDGSARRSGSLIHLDTALTPECTSPVTDVHGILLKGHALAAPAAGRPVSSLACRRTNSYNPTILGTLIPEAIATHVPEGAGCLENMQEAKAPSGGPEREELTCPERRSDGSNCVAVMTGSVEKRSSSQAAPEGMEVDILARNKQPRYACLQLIDLATPELPRTWVHDGQKNRLELLHLSGKELASVATSCSMHVG
jgi:hypothetical protein